MYTKARLVDEASAVIFGDPRNYDKHGFKCSKDYGIGDAEGNFPYALPALELASLAFSGYARRYKYTDVFNVDEKAAQEYDAAFPPKEKGPRRYSRSRSGR